MKINNIHHIAINTIDIDDSIRFYQDMLGLELTQRADMGFCELVYMKICDNEYLELFNLKQNCKTEPVDENNNGLRHIAFDVENIEQWYESLKSKNAKFIDELGTIEQIKKKYLLIEDPNKVVIELSEDM
ncbi:MAG: VOC family protein [Eubacteriales bacterium]